MQIGMYRQLAIVTVDNDMVVELYKIPHIFTNAEYTAMLYVYSFCYGSATAAVEEYCQRFPMRRIPDHRLFYIDFNILRDCGALPSAHIPSELHVIHVEEQ